MSLLGSLGSISFDQERERLSKIREPLTRMFRQSMAQIQSEVDASVGWLRDFLAAYAPTIKQAFEAQYQLQPLATQAVTDLYRNAQRLAPDQMAAAAQSELAAALGQAREEQMRRLSAMGVDPAAVRSTALDRAMDVMGSGELARTGTDARLRGAEGQARLVSMAEAARSGALGTAMAGLPMVQALAGLRAGVLGTPQQQGAGLAQLIAQEAQLRGIAQQSQTSALGSLMGGLGMLGSLGLGAYALGMFGAPQAAQSAAAAAQPQSMPSGLARILG